MRHAPRGSGGGHQSAAQRGLQAAIHQRRLAAARCADDRQKARAGQLVDHGVDLTFAAKEEVLLAFVERTKSREWVGQPLADRVSRAHGFAFPETEFTNSASVGSENPLRQSMSLGSSISTRSVLSLVAGSAR